MRIEQGGDAIVLSSSGATVVLSRATGLPTSIVGADNVERLAAAIEPTLWRPLTDNELGWGAERDFFASFFTRFFLHISEHADGERRGGAHRPGGT